LAAAAASSLVDLFIDNIRGNLHTVEKEQKGKISLLVVCCPGCLSSGFAVRQVINITLAKDPRSFPSLISGW
jgi:hypothetical protein